MPLTQLWVVIYPGGGIFSGDISLGGYNLVERIYPGGGIFSGDISLGGYNLRFTNLSSVERILSPTILESLYSN